MPEEERLKKRLRAAFLLLHLCPKCGEKCKVKHSTRRKEWIRKVKCPIHGLVDDQTTKEVWAALERYDGI